MLQKTVTLRLDAAQINKLKKDYGQISTPAKLIIEPFDKLKKLTIQDLASYFTSNEWHAMVKAQKGVLLNPHMIYNKMFFIEHLKTRERMDQTITKAGVDLQNLCIKIETLSHAEVYFLLMDLATIR